MKSFLKYFRYHSGSTVIRFLVILVLAVLLSAVVCSFDRHEVMMGGYQELKYPAIGVSGSVEGLAFIAAVLASVLPMLELMGFQNRRNMDTLLTLPVSREKMATVHFVNGMIQLVLTVTAIFLVAFFKMIPYFDVFDVGRLWVYYAFTLMGAAIVYAVFSFFFLQANTIADGIVFMALWSSFPALFVACIQEVFDLGRGDMKGLDWSYFFVFSPLTVVGNTLGASVTPTYYYDPEGGPSVILHDYSYHGKWEQVDTTCMIMWGIVALLCIVGYLITFRFKRSEQIGGISSSWFGYRTLIPLIAFSFIFALSASEIPVAAALILVGMVVGYVIYRRGFRFKIPDFISMGAFVLFAVLGIFL